MTLQLSTIVSNFAAIVIDGMKVCDLAHIPASITDRDCPILFPEPLNFLTNFTMTRQSFGGGSSAKMDITYDLHYTFCYAPVGAARELEKYEDMMDKATSILDAIIGIDTLAGAIDITPQDALEFGPVPDPAGNQFLGCRFVIHILEFGPNG